MMKRLRQSRQLVTSNDDSGTLPGDFLPADGEPCYVESSYRHTTRRLSVSANRLDETIVEEVRTVVRIRDA